MFESEYDTAYRTMGDMDARQATISEWAEATFQHTGGGIVLHLLSEVVELCMAAGVSYGSMRSVFEDSWSRFEEKKAVSVREEAADVTILAMTFAGWVGFSLAEEVARKHEINEKREWGKPNALGFTEHTKQERTGLPQQAHDTEEV